MFDGEAFEHPALYRVTEGELNPLKNLFCENAVSKNKLAHNPNVTTTANNMVEVLKVISFIVCLSSSYLVLNPGVL